MRRSTGLLTSVVGHAGWHDPGMSSTHQQPEPSGTPAAGIHIPKPSDLAASKRRTPAPARADQVSATQNGADAAPGSNRRGTKKSSNTPRDDRSRKSGATTKSVSANATKGTKRSPRRAATATGEDVSSSKATPFEGSRTVKRRREQLPTDWPSKPNDHDNYEWYATNEDSLTPAVIDPKSAINVYVPVPEAATLIRAGAAIVGTPQGEYIRIDFEDGSYQAAGYADLAERAHGRHVTNYPTIARMIINPSLLTLVGTFDPELGIVSIVESDAFEVWTGLRSTQIVTLSGAAARRRQWQEFLVRRPDVAMVPALRRQYERNFYL
jgi:hypothetical protein